MQAAGEDGKSLVCSPDTSSLKVLILTLLLDWWPAFGIYRIDDLIFIFIGLMTCRNFPMSMTGCLLKMSSSLHSSNRQLMGSGKCQKYKKNATIQESWEYWCWQDECCGSKRQATELRGSISQPILLHMLLLPEPNGHVGDSGRLKRRGDEIPVWGSSLLASLWRVRIPTTTKFYLFSTRASITW